MLKVPSPAVPASYTGQPASITGSGPASGPASAAPSGSPASTGGSPASAVGSTAPASAGAATPESPGAGSVDSSWPVQATISGRSAARSLGEESIRAGSVRPGYCKMPPAPTGGDAREDARQPVPVSLPVA